ncbi:MAG: ATP-dependent helicase [Pseudomonadota bacterium]
MKLSEKQKEILATDGHLLVTGGPGSGKTTISILKAAQVAEAGLRPSQEILFLSFARATISRVIEAIENENDIAPAIKRRIHVETYHSFFWRLLNAHGYLLGLPHPLAILTPAGEAIALSTIRNSFEAEKKLSPEQKADKRTQVQQERERQALTEGRVCFDLFARYVADLLERSERLRKLIAIRYPLVALDEFQDTNADQWRVVRQLGKESTLMALADPEQRIYDWIGADPARLDQFRAEFTPAEVDMQGDNHRSTGTDILLFGNDVLTGKFTKKQYVGIQLSTYPANEHQAYTTLITTTYAIRKRLVDSTQKGWSLAVLVPTKKMTRLVSDAFREPPEKLTPIHHLASIDLDAAILAAEIVSYLLQPHSLFHLERFVDLMCNYFHGKGGDDPSKTDLAQADSIRKAFAKYREKKAAGHAVPANSIMVAMVASYEASRAVSLTGDPEKDWVAIRKALDGGPCTRLKGIAIEVRNIRLLERGTQLRQELSQNWRDFGAYNDALSITQQAFVREHFSTQSKPEEGVIVMNMHKAKGKQFDEVIIFEGWPRYVKREIVANPDRIVRGNDRKNADSQSRQNMRVSITRGKKTTTILTPDKDPCVLLPRLIANAIPQLAVFHSYR